MSFGNQLFSLGSAVSGAESFHISNYTRLRNPIKGHKLMLIELSDRNVHHFFALFRDEFLKGNWREVAVKSGNFPTVIVLVRAREKNRPSHPPVPLSSTHPSLFMFSLSAMSLCYQRKWRCVRVK